jgi:hypothetical protein
MNVSVKKILSISIFSIAMAALEGAVVVYLRALYYPGEFSVEFKIIDQHILLVEIVREFATLIMLMIIGYLTGTNFKERFAYFLISFAIWDIFYYVWLKIFIGWPSSFLDWDILFLIPVTWIGPVAAPIICSLTMIVLALLLLKHDVSISKTVWAYLILGSSFVLFTFMKDYAELIFTNDFYQDFPSLMQNQNFIQKATALIPKPYQWNIFLAGELMFILGAIRIWSNRKSRNVVAMP